MKRMTDTELDARIARFMDRKKEDFPSLFGRLETLKNGDRPTFLGPLTAKRALRSL